MNEIQIQDTNNQMPTTKKPTPQELSLPKAPLTALAIFIAVILLGYFLYKVPLSQTTPNKQPPKEPTRPIEVDTSCKIDSDCVLAISTNTCCTTCARAVNKKALKVSGWETFIKGRLYKPTAKNCDMVICSLALCKHPEKAMCVDGNCKPQYTGISETGPPTVWDTYRNDEFGFQVDFPPGFYFHEDTENYEPFGSSVHFIENKYEYGSMHYPEMAIRIIESDLSARKWLDTNSTSTHIFDTKGKYIFYGVDFINETELDGIEALQFPSSAASALQLPPSVASGTADHFLLQKNGFIIDMQSRGSDVGVIQGAVFDHFVKSFKFTE